MNLVFPYIPTGSVIKYVPAQDRFMRFAEDACHELSTDHHHPTGAVLVKDGNVIARAANQSALKNKYLINLHRQGFCIRKFLKIPSGQKYWLCPGCASARSHAETLVVKEAFKSTIKPNGADVYLWGHWWCCEPCWNAMITAGIRDVYLLEGSEKLFNPKYPENVVGGK
ncbi:MAG: deaminase [bacterium]|nr:deaminase [bacterium]